MSERQIVAKALLLVMVCAFLGYVLFWSAKSVPWIIEISVNPQGYLPAAGLQHITQLSMDISYLMEYAGFAGLIVRLGGAVFALVSALLILRSNEVFSWRVRSKISWALLLEGLYFFSLIPSVIYLLGFSSLPLTSRICLSIALTTQMVLISPILILLSRKLRKPDTQLDRAAVTRLAVIACLTYIVALYVTYWTKWLEMSILEGLHWLLSLPVVVAFVNTAVTFTITVVFAAVAARQSLKGNWDKGMRLWGAAGFFLSLHLVIFVAYCVGVNAAWMAEFGELWMIPLMAVGVYLLLRKNRGKARLEGKNEQPH
jgi:hypothetical protein